MGNSAIAAYRWNRLGAAVLGASFFVVGMGFTALGLTFLPFIGLFVGMGCFALARGFWSLGRKVDLPVLMDDFAERKLAAHRAIPVATLPMSRKSEAAYDLDAATVDAATIGTACQGADSNAIWANRARGKAPS